MKSVYKMSISILFETIEAEKPSEYGFGIYFSNNSDENNKRIQSLIKCADKFIEQSKDTYRFVEQPLPEDGQSFDIIASVMSRIDAKKIRKWRIEEGYSWRGIAGGAFDNNICGRKWEPSTNQLMGIELCRAAAKFFNEDGDFPPWN